MPTEHERLRAFAEEMLGIAWEGCDADGGTIQDTAKEHGLLRVVEGGYDPEKHGENTLHDAAPGDPWYEVTWKGGEPDPSIPDYAAALAAVKEVLDDDGYLDGCTCRIYDDGAKVEGEPLCIFCAGHFSVLAAAVRHIADLEAANEMRAFTNTTIAAERDEARAERDKLEGMSTDMERQYHEVRERLALAESAAGALPEDVAAVALENEALRERLAAVEAERNDAVKACDDNWVTHQELTALRERIAAVEKERDRLAANIQELGDECKRIPDLALQRDEARAERDALDKAYRKTTFAKVTDENAALRERLARAHEALRAVALPESYTGALHDGGLAYLPHAYIEKARAALAEGCDDA